MGQFKTNFVLFRCVDVCRLLQNNTVLSQVFKLGQQFSLHHRDGSVVSGRWRADLGGQEPDSRDMLRRGSRPPSLRDSLVQLIPRRLVTAVIDAERRRRPAGPGAGSQLDIDVHLPTSTRCQQHVQMKCNY